MMTEQLNYWLQNYSVIQRCRQILEIKNQIYNGTCQFRTTPCDRHKQLYCLAGTVLHNHWCCKMEL